MRTVIKVIFWTAIVAAVVIGSGLAWVKLILWMANIEN